MKDPIVDEIRKNREQLARQYDYDVHKIFAGLRKREKKNLKKVFATIGGKKPVKSSATTKIKLAR